MFNFLKKKKKVNIIADRIRDLDNKLWLISIAGKESRVESKIRYFRTNDTGTSKEYKVIALDTYFGERKIATNGKILYSGNSDLIQEAAENSDWSFNFNYLFYIEVRANGSVFVKFAKGVKMSKEEIDLAILEFELVVDNIYTKITKLDRDYNDIVDYLVGEV